jgi:hypothetical protein
VSPINSSASKKADSDKDSVVSDYFYTSAVMIVQLRREWWKGYISNDIQIEGFKKLSEVDSSVAEPKSDDKIIHFSKLDEAGYVYIWWSRKNRRVIGKCIMSQMGKYGRKPWIRN